MTFPRDRVEEIIAAIVSREIGLIVCAHTGRSYDAMTPEAREGVCAPYAPNVRRAVNALAEVARASYEAGVQTTHRDIVASGSPWSARAEEAIARAAEERRRK